MKIQIGEIYMDRVTNQKITYPNKTRKYLLPCLKEYGDVFVNHVNNVFKVAVGIGDVITDNCGFQHEKHIFILIDTSLANAWFIKFINWVRDQSMFEDDYVFDNIQKSKYHMVVLKFPEKYYDSFNNFREGKYSQMFNQETIDAFFHSYPEVIRVFLKDHNYRVEFTEKVNRKFKLEGKYKVQSNEWHGELDFPPNDKTEIFNHYLKKQHGTTD